MQVKLCVALLALAPLLAVASPTPAEKFTKLKVKRQSFMGPNGVVDVSAVNQHVSEVQTKIARGFANFKKNTGKTHPNDPGTVTKRAPSPVAPVKRAAATAAVIDFLTDDFDGDLWQGTAQVGTPLEDFSVDFDTGSSDFFLPGTKCVSSNCEGHRIFNTAQSRTAVDQHQTFSISFADGSSVAGEVFSDTVAFGPLVATQQTVVAASQYSNGFSTDNFPPDGLLGLAFISVSETGRSPVFETLVLNNQTTQPVFGVTLLDNGGELVLGGTDTSAFSGALTFAPLTETNPPAFWEIVVSSASVGSRAVVTAPQDAIVDTGTTLLIVDPASANAIYAAIPGARSAANLVGPGFFTIPCNAVPSNVGFTIAGRTFTLSADTLNFGLLEEGTNLCLGGIMGATEGFWILGDVFLRNFYTEFDFTGLRVGFATAR